MNVHTRYIYRAVIGEVWSCTVFLGLGCQKSIYRFHVPALIPKQAVVRTSGINSVQDVSTDVANPRGYRLSIPKGRYGKPV